MDLIEPKNTILEIKNSKDGFNRRLDRVEDIVYNFIASQNIPQK